MYLAPVQYIMIKRGVDPLVIYLFAMGVCLFTFYYVFTFILEIITIITTHLDINCFSVKKQLSRNKRTS